MNIEETKEFELVNMVCLKIKDMVKGCNPAMAPTYLKDFIVGLDVAGELLGRATAEDIRAKEALERSKSMAYFDFAPSYLDTKGIKHSDAAKSKAVLLDVDVQNAVEVKSKTEAILVVLKNKLQVLRLAHDSLKKITYAQDGM